MDLRQFRTQHQDILRDLGHLEAACSDNTPVDAEAAASLVMQTSARIHLHLAVEDGFLYPQIYQLGDPDTVTLARRLHTEMGRLLGEFREFAHRYMHAQSIRDDPGGFCDLAQRVVAALRQRIECEERDLYPRAGDL